MYRCTKAFAALTLHSLCVDLTMQSKTFAVSSQITLPHVSVGQPGGCRDNDPEAAPSCKESLVFLNIFCMSTPPPSLLA